MDPDSSPAEDERMAFRKRAPRSERDAQRPSGAGRNRGTRTGKQHHRSHAEADATLTGLALFCSIWFLTMRGATDSGWFLRLFIYLFVFAEHCDQVDRDYEMLS